MSSYSSSSSTTNSDAIPANPAIKEIVKEMEGCWTPPMDVRLFMDKFFPTNPSKSERPMPTFNTNTQKALKKAVTGTPALHIDKIHPAFNEDDFHELLIDNLSEYCPSFELRRTSQHYDTTSYADKPTLVKPSISAYHRSSSPPQDTPTVISRVDLFFSLSLNINTDRFTHDYSPFYPETDEELEMWHQTVVNAGAILATQYRTHCFSIQIVEEYARILRWDRGGVIVSQAFCLWQEPYLAEFLWRYDNASLEDRGYDTAVCYVDEDSPDSRDRRMVWTTRKALGFSNREPIAKFNVLDEESGQVETFYGAKMVFKSTKCPVGRCTRGFHVVDLQGKVVFLKEGWRSDTPDAFKEGAMYTKLRKAGVPHLPTILAAGDAGGPWQRTCTWGYRSGMSSSEMEPRRHHLVVIREIGKPLTEFSTEYELVAALRDVLEALQKAHEVARVLHCDISAGNILIYNGRGLLIDWDLCEDADAVPQNGCSGTWDFISARLLQATEPEKHLPEDDMESIYHLLCWIYLQFCRHELPSTEISRWMKDIYNERYFCSVICDDMGGDGKVTAFLERQFMTKSRFPDGPVRDLIFELEEVFAVGYENPPTNQQRVLYERLKEGFAGKPDVWKDTVWYRYTRRKEKLSGFQWMLDRLTVTAEELAKQPEYTQRPMYRKGIWEAFRPVVATVDGRRR
ncbi:hypothetical protein PM082_014880 [Marasmius tenuissimus]|nr:hypothetical protein PM082_014880 [Marasmius tenuissimus]